MRRPFAIRALAVAALSCSLPAWAGNAQSAQTLRDGTVRIKGQIDGLIAAASPRPYLEHSETNVSEEGVAEADNAARAILLQVSQLLDLANDAADRSLDFFLAGNNPSGENEFVRACLLTSATRSGITRARYAARQPPGPGDTQTLLPLDSIFARAVEGITLLKQSVGCP